jgi:hypothetical protein
MRTNELVVLYRPVGRTELALIEKSGFRSFPPRLVEQPIFYPVTNEQYATQIARDWNARLDKDKVGFVTKFAVRKTYLSKHETRLVGGSEHEEYWIPAEHLSEFNANIVGKIEVIAEFRNE